MARGSDNASEWHFSQDSVFFHAVDELDTRRTVLVLTTNRPDLVDDAIRDRFLTYQIDYPAEDVLIAIAVSLAERHEFSRADVDCLIVDVRAAHSTGTLLSIRDVQRLVVRFFVDVVTRSRLS
jgi:hypothetical protein